MKKNLFAKLLAIVLFFIFSSFPVFAKQEQSTISKILINPLKNGSFSLNIYFNNDYKGKGYIEKNANGLYSLYLTDANFNLKQPKIIYRNNSDKRKIRLKLNQKPLNTMGKVSNYVTVDISMKNDYAIKMIPRNNADDRFLLAMLPFLNAFPLFILGLGVLVFFLLRKISLIKGSNYHNNSYTKFPSSFNISKSNYNNNFKYDRNIINTYIKKHLDRIQIETAKKSSFKCFDIPFADQKTTRNIDFMKAMNKSSMQTNPIDNEVLDIPYADEVIKEEKGPKLDKNGAEILSTANINRNKGFYISKIDGVYCLFGYIYNNIFLIKKFKDLLQINLQARFYDETPEGEIYIVRVDSYKSMVEISKDSIRELVVL